MKTTKEKVLEEFPDLREEIVTRLVPVGRKGFGKLKKFLQIWQADVFICEEGSTKKAYSVARSRLRGKQKDTKSYFVKPLQEEQVIDPNREYSYEEWKRQLVIVTKQVAPNSDFTINDVEAKKCFDSGMSAWQTFRENFQLI